MKRFVSFFSACGVAGLLGLLGPGATVMSSGCGGCPWVSVGDVDLFPETTCLEVRATDEGSGGCVNPTLAGTNHCTETLVIPREYVGEADLEVPPGGAFSVEILLESSSEDGDEYHFAVPLELGEETVVVKFNTWL